MRALIVDLFAGAGGASIGIRDALGRDPASAIVRANVGASKGVAA